MKYLKIDGVDLSHLVSSLAFTKNYNYSAQTNASGNTVVDVINYKWVVEVGFIPMTQAQAYSLSECLSINPSVAFLDEYGDMIEIDCLMPSNTYEYYTIQDAMGKILFQPTNITFQEL